MEVIYTDNFIVFLKNSSIENQQNCTVFEMFQAYKKSIEMQLLKRDYELDILS